MTNDRPYRKAMSIEAALAEVRLCSGTQFDPELVEIFLSIDHEAHHEDN
jgi:HD-GYP domain-containing protein (c-di-GMP phosphodiesterase class II)